MGGISPHRKGIQICFFWNGQRHRPTLRIQPTPVNLKFAANLKGEIERAIALGTYSWELYTKHFPTSRIAQNAPKSEPKPAFSDVAKLWLQASSHLSTGTLIKYRQALAFWETRLGELPIDEIQYSTLASLANAQGWGSKNRNNMLIPLRRVMETAFLDGHIATNPAERIKASKVQKEPPDPLTAEEVERVLGLIEHRYHPQIRNVIEFAIFTGMRPSEFISLRWGDIDFTHGLARVQRARTFGSEHQTKTYKVRDVEMNARGLAALVRQKEHTFLRGEYVFEHPVTGQPYSQERPLRESYWVPTLKALGIRHRAFYQTRHTFATLNLMAGANPMWVSKQLGHSNMNMLLTVYAKWIDGADKRSERGKIDAIFASTATRTPPESAVSN